tara:strand:- start:2323 stop:2877 length:555 start_codon:yes stop_codon:yes gene_type:complete
MWRSLFSSSCDEWERSFEGRKALVEVQMANMAKEAVKRAEKRAAEAEKRAADMTESLNELQMRFTAVQEKAKMEMTHQKDIITKHELTISNFEKLIDLLYVKNAEKRAKCFEDLMCPITSALMEDPVVDRDGNSYERKSIEMWLMSNRTSPITRRPMKVEELVPNRALRNAIEVAIKAGNVEKQ